MEKIIEWRNPDEVTPPFNKKIMVALGSQISTNCGQTWNKSICIRTVVMTKQSPNDDDSFGELMSGAYEFKDLQFILNDPDACGDELDWYSDAICYWADMPDLSLTTQHEN